MTDRHLSDEERDGMLACFELPPFSDAVGFRLDEEVVTSYTIVAVMPDGTEIQGLSFRGKDDAEHVYKRVKEKFGAK
ncbi:MAG: hypothetical protein ACE5FA_00410 [Dehalococcoidia bacterium]